MEGKDALFGAALEAARPCLVAVVMADSAHLLRAALVARQRLDSHDPMLLLELALRHRAGGGSSGAYGGSGW